MQVLEFLENSGVKYESREHKPTFSSQYMAEVEHEKGRFVAKPVMVKADGKYIMCVLAACCKVDLVALKNNLGAKSVELAEEDEIGRLFGNCELGAEPPFGNLYDIPTIMDKTLENDDHILFQAGSHDKAIWMNMADYRKLVNPRIMEFTYHIGT